MVWVSAWAHLHERMNAFVLGLKMMSLILHHRSCVRSSKDFPHKQGRGCPDEPRPEGSPVPVARLPSLKSLWGQPAPSSRLAMYRHCSPDPDVDKSRPETGHRFPVCQTCSGGSTAWVAALTRPWHCAHTRGKGAVIRDCIRAGHGLGEPWCLPDASPLLARPWLYMEKPSFLL